MVVMLVFDRQVDGSVAGEIQVKAGAIANHTVSLLVDDLRL